MQKKRIFIGGPFTGIIDSKTGLIDNSYKEIYTLLIDILEKNDYEVGNAHKREKWGGELMTYDVCTSLDYQEVCRCDTFLAFPGSPASPGTHIEIGWASALKKRIILLLQSGQYYSPLTLGVGKITNVHYIEYDNFNDMLIKVLNYFKLPQVEYA